MVAITKANGGSHMEAKKRLKIDLDELCSAMDDSSYENEYYLDLQTSEILFVSDYVEEEESDKLRDKIDEQPDRYERIPKV
jgi:hypothetical protein